MLYRDSSGRFRRAPFAGPVLPCPPAPPKPYDGPSWLGAALAVGAIVTVLAVVIWALNNPQHLVR